MYAILQWESSSSAQVGIIKTGSTRHYSIRGRYLEITLHVYWSGFTLDNNRLDDY